MSRWLYKTEHVSWIRIPETLNVFGKNGWELISVIPNSGRYDLIFKKLDPRLTPLEEAMREEEIDIFKSEIANEN